MESLKVLSVHQALFHAILRNLKGLRVLKQEGNKLIWQAFFNTD
ncbi:MULTISPECIES: hypothetical protein [Sporosarcina]|nr:MULTISPECIES: hypothetical protein [Sporosarcina]